MLILLAGRPHPKGQWPLGRRRGQSTVETIPQERFLITGGLQKHSVVITDHFRMPLQAALEAACISQKASG